MTETYPQRLERLYGEYFRAETTGALLKIDEELGGLLNMKGVSALSAPLEKKARALYLRNRAKAFVVNYSQSGFGTAHYKKMWTELQNLISECPKDFENTAAAVSDAMTVLDALQLAAGGMAAVTAASDENEAFAAMKDAEARLSVPLDFLQEYAFLAPQARAYTEARRGEAAAACKQLRDAKYGEIYRKACAKLSEFTGYTFYPAILDDPTLAAQIRVAVTPYGDEAELLIAAYAKTKRRGEIFRVDLSAIAAESAEACAYLFQRLATEDGDTAFFGAEKLSPPRRAETFASICVFAKENPQKILFVHDTSPNRNAFRELESVAEDVSKTYVYVSLPDFDEASEALREGGFLVTAEDVEYFRKNAVFCGFIGFNTLHFAGKSGWRRAVKDKSDKNRAAGVEYLKGLPNSALFLDGAWRYAADSAEKKSNEGRAPFSFDYDEARAYSQKNLRAIFSVAATLKERCGLLVKYCLFFGEDDSVWTALAATEEGRAERALRMENATRLIARLLDTMYIPKVTVIEKEDWENKAAGGLCCGGGAEIKYRADCLTDAGWSVDSVLHEMYHSFQHTATDNRYRAWWGDELGVSAERIAEWSKNNGAYIDINRNKNAYSQQIMEADARIFATESLNGAGRQWSEILFET